MVPAEVERTWVAQHEHDDEVGPIAIERNGSLIQKNSLCGYQHFFIKGVDLLCMKGFLSQFDGTLERQGVSRRTYVV